MFLSLHINSISLCLRFHHYLKTYMSLLQSTHHTSLFSNPISKCFYYLLSVWAAFCNNNIYNVKKSQAETNHLELQLFRYTYFRAIKKHHQ